MPADVILQEAQDVQDIVQTRIVGLARQRLIYSYLGLIQPIEGDVVLRQVGGNDSVIWIESQGLLVSGGGFFQLAKKT